MNCPHVLKGKNGITCSDYLLEPELCKNCGFYPEEHERRVKLLRSGKVKTFLHINLDKFATLKTREWERNIK